MTLGYTTTGARSISTLLFFALIIIAPGQVQAVDRDELGPHEQLGDYHLYKSMVLNQEQHGIEGAIQLLQDRRITEEHRRYGSMCGWEPELWKSFEEVRPRPALVRLVDKNNVVIDFKQVSPLSDISTVRLYQGNRPSYMVIEDKYGCFGSYSGITTEFVEVTNGKLQRLEALDSKTNTKEPIHLMKSLKTVWKFDKRSDHSITDILEVACRPDFSTATRDNIDFLIFYRRYYFDGHQWIKLERQEKGFWEDEGSFPERSLFP